MGELIDDEETGCEESSGDADKAEAFAKSKAGNGVDWRDEDPGSNDGWTLI